MKKQSANREKTDQFDRETVGSKLETWFPNLSVSEVESLLVFQEELLKFNKTINLISASTVKNVEAVHVGDCVNASKLIGPLLLPEHPVYDLGSGNGCPGLIFAALHRDRRTILVDRDQRKMEFCKHAAAAMRLSNVEFRIINVEDLKANSLVNAIARGFAPFSRSLLSYRKLFAKGGRFFHLKGDGWANEIAQLPSQLFTHWRPTLVGEYNIPGSTIKMVVVSTEKVSE